MSVVVKLKSGRFVGSTQELKVKLKRLLAESVEKGTEKAITNLIQRAPKKTGRFRRFLQFMLKSQTRNLNNRNKIVISFEKHVMKLVPYAQYHIKGMELIFPRGYKNPTTPGTEPVYPREIMAEIGNRIKEEFTRSLRREGLRFNKVATVRVRVR